MEAVCAAPHSERLRLSRQAFRDSVASDFTGWALLSRGFEQLLEEQYDYIDGALHEVLTGVYSYERDGKAHAQYTAYFPLVGLLFAAAHRHRADRAMDLYEAYRYGDKEELQKRSERELEQAVAEYQRVTETPASDARVRSVAWHGLGKCISLQCRYEEKFRHNHQTPFRWSDRPELLQAAKRNHQQSIDIAKEKGFSYAPPLNALAWLHWQEYRENSHQWTPDRRGELRGLCEGLLDQAINAGGGKYAQPLILKAQVRHRQHIDAGLAPDRKETQALIAEAIRLSPFDRMILSELQGFASAVRDDLEAGRVTPDFYRSVQFVTPSEATTEGLNRYLAADLTRCKPKDLNQLLVLRRWSSYTPLVRLQEHNTTGGGYLLEWEGTRIAVDPGVGFVRNLHDHGYRVQDLDAVIVTHQHVDHTEDMEAVLSILKTCKAIKAEPRNGQPTTFLLTNSGKERWARMIVSALELKSAHERMKILRASAGGGIDTTIGGIDIAAVPLQNHQDAIDEGYRPHEHGRRPEDGRPPTGCGLKFTLRANGRQPCILGITSDTGYLSSETDTKRISQYYSDCNILVLHLSRVTDMNGPVSDTTSRVAEKEQRKYVPYACADLESVGFPGFVYKKHLDAVSEPIRRPFCVF